MLDGESSLRGPFPAWLLWRTYGAHSRKENLGLVGGGTPTGAAGEHIRMRHHPPEKPTDPHGGTILQVEKLESHNDEWYTLSPRIARHEHVAKAFVKANPEWECEKIDLSIPPRHPGADPNPGRPTTIPPGGITHDYE